MERHLSRELNAAGNAVTDGREVMANLEVIAAGLVTALLGRDIHTLAGISEMCRTIFNGCRHTLHGTDQAFACAPFGIMLAADAGIRDIGHDVTAAELVVLQQVSRAYGQPVTDLGDVPHSLIERGYLVRETGEQPGSGDRPAQPFDEVRPTILGRWVVEHPQTVKLQAAEAA